VTGVSAALHRRVSLPAGSVTSVLFPALGIADVVAARGAAAKIDGLRPEDLRGAAR
jgi:hypothetical protein